MPPDNSTTMPEINSAQHPSWSADNSRLLFVYRPSILPYGTKPAAEDSCTAPRFGRLAIAPARRPSSSRSWKLVMADRKCSFTAAAFDRRGIAAVRVPPEHRWRGFSVDPNLGQTYLLQLDHHQRVSIRVPLKPGWKTGLVSTEPRNGGALISQHQSANAGHPDRDWVWQFNGPTFASLRATQPTCRPSPRRAVVGAPLPE